MRLKYVMVSQLSPVSQWILPALFGGGKEALPPRRGPWAKLFTEASGSSFWIFAGRLVTADKHASSLGSTSSWTNVRPDHSLLSDVSPEFSGVSPDALVSPDFLRTSPDLEILSLP